MSDKKLPLPVTKEEIQEYELVFKEPGAGERALKAGKWVLVPS
jgi:hypothetical protein